MGAVVEGKNGKVISDEGVVEIPENALVSCPMVDFKLRAVARCVGCKAFGGLADRFPGGTHPFEQRYIVKCFGAPVNRQVVAFVKG